MTHPTRTTLAAISLLLCVISAAACVVSYVRPVGITNVASFRDSEGGLWGCNYASFAANTGKLYLHRFTWVPTAGRPKVFDRHQRRIGTCHPAWGAKRLARLDRLIECKVKRIEKRRGY